MGLAERNPERADAALLARRATLRPEPDLIDGLVGLSRPDAVAKLVNAAPAAGEAAPVGKSEDTVRWWVNQIVAPGSGLHERMTFFWHTVIPTHRYASGPQELIATQLNLLRTHALGNFRALLQAMVVDGAMIKYLDADSSTAKRPNENLARELMELFTVGIGHYSEDDVRQAALAMTGWRVNRDTRVVSFDPGRAYTEPTTFLGETRRWDVASITDRLCDHPATAARIGAMVWKHFTGQDLNSGEAGRLGVWWQEQNLEILPLVQRVLLSDGFWVDHYVRPRSGFEYYAAIQPILGFPVQEVYRMRALGQGLYEPPNVGGWPGGDRWLSPDSMLRRASQLFSVPFKEVPGGMTAGIDEILDRLALYVVSDETMAALNQAATSTDIYDGDRSQLLWRVALSSPEFNLL